MVPKQTAATRIELHHLVLVAIAGGLVVELIVEQLGAPKPPTVLETTVITAGPMVPPAPPEPEWRWVDRLELIAGQWDGLTIRSASGRWSLRYRGVPTDLICKISGGPQLRNPIDLAAGSWWIGYCSGFTLRTEPVVNDVFEITFQLYRDGRLRMNFGEQTIGPVERRGRD